jgi:hypothetical protein
MLIDLGATVAVRDASGTSVLAHARASGRPDIGRMIRDAL